MDSTTAAIKLKQELKLKIDSDLISDAFYDAGIMPYYEEKVKTPALVRLTLPFALVTIVVLFMLTPINYMITGHWGYKYEPLANWLRSLGF